VTAEVPATVVPLRSEVKCPAEDWLSHPLDCECDQCLYPEPKYARPYPGSGVTDEYRGVSAGPMEAEIGL
jgi:hypothetical protein